MLRSALQRTENLQKLFLDRLIGNHGQLEAIAGTGRPAKLSRLGSLRKFSITSNATRMPS